MFKYFLSTLLVLSVLATLYIFKMNTPLSQNVTQTTDPVSTSVVSEPNPTTTNETSSGTPIAFLYQYVGKFVQGAGDNSVRLGMSEDYTTVQSYGIDVLNWTVSKTEKDGYGDPVFSRLSDGSWAMTSWTGPEDSRGPGSLLYYESSCPTVTDSAVVTVVPSSAQGCVKTPTLTGGKTSQIFAADDGNYVFHMISGEVYLAHLSDAENSAMDLESMCVLKTPVTTVSDLDYGESTLLFSKDDTGLLLSDTAIGRRADGTWVLFVKGIAPDNGCKPNTTCELCTRGVYRTTSTDLMNWSPLEKVVSQASVPEAFTTVDGTVWLYWQDFSDTCAADDLNIASFAPISAAYEQEGSYELSEPITVSFPDEDFETDHSIHYATNANPVTLPDAAAVEALEACAK